MLPDPEAILAAAHDYRARGWRVIKLYAVDEAGRCECGRSNCSSAGKHPVDTGWQNTPRSSGADIQAEFDDGGIWNVGIATGDPSGFFVLDIDLDKPGTLERVKEMQAGRKFPATFTARTGGGGYQYYFAMPDFPVTNSARRLPDGVDVRGTGGQVVAPPSRSGKGPYKVAIDAVIAPAPEWLLELVRPLPPAAPVDLQTLPKLTDLSEAEQRRLGTYVDRAVQAEIRRLDECKERGWDGPGWNQTTFEVSCTLVELANSPWAPLTLEEALATIQANAPRDKNFGAAEIEGCFASALKTVDGKGRALPEDRTARITVIPGDPLTDPDAMPGPMPAGPAEAPVTPRDWTDLGNARRLVDEFGEHLRYIPESGQWAAYGDGVWIMKQHAGMTAAQHMIEGLVDREAFLYSEEPTGEDGDGPSERDRFFKWAKAQQMSARIDACVRQATGRKEIIASLTDFDRDPDILNVKNGVIDLRTGELHPHEPTQLTMLQSPIVYDPAAKAPQWQAFLERCLPDPAVREYLQKATGYSLSGSMAEQALFIHHGPGANGKSVYLVVANMLAGGYAQVVPRETLLSKGNNNEHPTSIARMRGRRFLQASETGAGKRLDEEMVKGLTGGEQQTARFIGKDGFDFTPTGKIHLVTNHLPRLTDAESIWRRLHLIAWAQTIPVHERNANFLREEYWVESGEAPGILAWAVRGAVAWYRDGLGMPESMKRDLAEYRSDQDVLGEFLALRLEPDPHGFAATSEIYGAYQAWCFANGIRNVMTAQDLGKTLKERRYETHRTGRSRGFRARLIPVLHLVDQDQADPLAVR